MRNCNCYSALTVGDLADELVSQGNVSGHHVEQSVHQLDLKLMKNCGQNNLSTGLPSRHSSPYPYLDVLQQKKFFLKEKAYIIVDCNGHLPTSYQLRHRGWLQNSICVEERIIPYSRSARLVNGGTVCAESVAPFLASLQSSVVKL